MILPVDFAELVASVRLGRCPPLSCVREILAREKRTDQDLVEAVANAPHVQPGEPCPTCRSGRFRIVSSKLIDRGKWQRQRIECNRCGHAPAVPVRYVPAAIVRRRTRRET